MNLTTNALRLGSALTCLLASVGYYHSATAENADDAPTAEEAAIMFGTRQAVLDISLSPSGDKVAFIGAGPGHTEVLNVVDLAGDAVVKPIFAQGDVDNDLVNCDWATDERIVCQAYGLFELPSGVMIPFDRMISLNADGTDAKELSARDSAEAIATSQFGGEIVALDVEGKEGRILVTREYIRERTIGTRLANDKEGLGVDMVDVESGRRRMDEQPLKGAVSYVADEKGRVRLTARMLTAGNGDLTGGRVFLYRTQDSDKWVELEQVTIDGRVIGSDDFNPIAVDSKRNVAFVAVKKNGFNALAQVALDGSAKGEILLARDDVDLGSLIRIGRQRRVVGASYATEKRQVAYFDPEIRALAEGLAQALPDTPLINMVGASSDENRILVIASSDTQPGMVYLFDKAKRSLEPLVPVRNHLANMTMGEMRPITYPAADGTSIPGYLTLPPNSDGQALPSVVLPHGGPAARDVWGFDWIVQFFVARGYAVLQPNYRGSSGYGEAWYGKNGYQSWETAISDVNDAGRWLVAQGIANPEKLAIAGWSYGGYAALQSQVVDPELYKAVVAIAPVTDLEFLREDARAYTSFRLRDEQLGRGPHIEEGSPLQHPEKFIAPVALYHGTQDLNVDVRHSREMERALKSAGKKVSYIEYEDLEHSLRDSTVRAKMLMDIDAFFSSAFGT